MSDAPLTLLGISGSLRHASYNTALLRAARELVPEGMAIEIYDRLGEIPPYNDDVRQAGLPEPVADLRARIAAADALLIATPEYNYSVPGVLKNAIDWASRPSPDLVLQHKPVGIVGATTGNFGTVRAQLALRQVFVFTESYVLLKPEVLVRQAASVFSDGRLTDEPTRDLLRQFLAALAAWTHHHRRRR
jgi:chromate reductase, NAD(P)H dehydrogenase (quinone)